MGHIRLPAELSWAFSSSESPARQSLSRPTSTTVCISVPEAAREIGEPVAVA